MPLRHRVLAVLVATIWGVNFVITDVALRDVPPLTLTALRFAASALPLIFFVPRPTARVRYVIAYGFVFGCLKFGPLYVAMAHGMPAGLASLVLQAQALFSVLLASGVLGERMRPTQLAGILVASSGIAALAWGSGEEATLIGFGLTIGAAVAWAVANVIVRSSGERRPLSMLAYSSLVPPLPLLGLSAAVDGPAVTLHALTHLTVAATGAILFIAYVSTLLGFGIWNRLLAHYPVARVAPFSLLVPIVGLATSAVVLDERISVPVGLAALTVLAGLALVIRLGAERPRSSVYGGVSRPGPAPSTSGGGHPDSVTATATAGAVDPI